MTPPEATSKSSKLANVAGYSLAELLVGSAVMVIVLLAVYMVYDTGIQDSARGTARADVQQNVRVAMETMAREMRTAGYNPYKTLCAPAPPAPPGYSSSDIVAVTTPTLSPASVTFWADVDGDNCLDQVTYTFVSANDPTKPCDSSNQDTVGRLTRSVQAWSGTAWNPTSPTADVAQCVSDLTMTYYNTSDAPTTDPTKVARIKISITGKENTRGWGTKSYTLVSDVRLRNL